MRNGLGWALLTGFLLTLSGCGGSDKPVNEGKPPPPGVVPAQGTPEPKTPPRQDKK